MQGHKHEGEGSLAELYGWLLFKNSDLMLLFLPQERDRRCRLSFSSSALLLLLPKACGHVPTCSQSGSHPFQNLTRATAEKHNSTQEEGKVLQEAV